MAMGLHYLGVLCYSTNFGIRKPIGSVRLSSGKAVATGAKSVDDIHAAFQKVHNELTDAGFQLWDFDQDSIEIQNLVVTHNYGNTLDLSELIITMPLSV